MGINQLKAQAAHEAVKQVESGMVVGLGTGSTAQHAVDRLAQRMRQEGLQIIGVPTSDQTEAQARSLGIPLATLEEQPRIDLAIDGADEIQQGTLHLIKGAGGALLREKLVEVCTERLIIIADESKLVGQLGLRFAVPVEVVRFAWESTRSRLRSLGCEPILRTTAAGTPYVTDEQHLILDCDFDPISDAASLAHQIKSLPGVVEHGLFIDMADQVILATIDGIKVLSRA